MKLGRFEITGQAVYGLVDGDRVWAAKGSVFGEHAKGKLLGRLATLKTLVPCEPTKILAIGRNFPRSDIEILQEDPQVFLKPLTSLIAIGDPIIYPWMSQRVIYEPELAVVIGQKTKNVPADVALDHVLGYTCANDVTAKDLNLKDRLGAGRAKIFDSFCPLGPLIALAVDGNDLAISANLNGELGPSSRTSNMIWKVEEVVSFISCLTTLLPGDIILLGTPGTGTLRPGDVVEVEIEGIGVLRNPVAASGSSSVRWRRT